MEEGARGRDVAKERERKRRDRGRESRGVGGAPRPTGPASPVRAVAKARRSPHAGHGSDEEAEQEEQDDEQHAFAYATRSQRLANVSAHDETVIERMVEALEEAPQSLHHSKKSWLQHVFREWVRENYQSADRNTPEYARMRFLWDAAVTDFESNAQAVEEREGRYNPSPRRGQFEPRPHIDFFGVRNNGDRVAVSGDGHHYGMRVDRSVKSRAEVGRTEYTGKYSGAVRHTIVRESEIETDKEKDTYGKPRKTTYVSRVGGGHVVLTAEEEEEEAITVRVRVPSSEYNTEDAEYELEIKPSETIRDLKQLIHDSAHVPVKCQRLFSTRIPRLSTAERKKQHLRKLKQDTWSLQEYGVEDGEVLAVQLVTEWKPPWWLLVFTALELVLVHLDHSVPPRCVDVLDLNTKYGECDVLLRSGEFTCEHDFCPGCNTDHEGFQAHECDLSCGFCPEPEKPCPEEPGERPPCANKLDAKVGAGTCDSLVSEGSFTCARDFCYDCEGVTGSSEGVGTGGHQTGQCDLTCNFCDETPLPAPACDDNAPLYPVEELPDGYIWETPVVSEVVADVIVILTNIGGLLVICYHDDIRQPLDVMKVVSIDAPLAQILNGLVVVGAAGGMMFFSTKELDLWVWGYAFLTGVALIWSGTGEGEEGRAFPATGFYPVGLAVTSMEIAMVLVFIGFDYSLGLVFLTIAYYTSSMITVLSTPPWIRAMFFVTQLLVADGLFFWGALFGLQFHSSVHSGLPVQLVLLAALVRLTGSLGWVWSMSREPKEIPAGAELDRIHNRWMHVAKHGLIGGPGVLLAVASGHKIDHRRLMLDNWTLGLVVLLSVLPLSAALSAACRKIKNKAGWSLAALGEHNWRPTWREIQGQQEDAGWRKDGHEAKKTVLEAGDFRSPRPDGVQRSPIGGGARVEQQRPKEKRSRTSPGRLAMAEAV